MPFTPARLASASRMTKTRVVPQGASVADAVSAALPVPLSDAAARPVDLEELRDALEQVAHEARTARAASMGLADAVADPRFPALGQLHRDLRDAMFVEIPGELRPWVDELHSQSAPAENLGAKLTQAARQPGRGTLEQADLQAALSEVLLFESIRLRLLSVVWQTGEFERLGGDEADVDRIAWREVEALLASPEIEDPHVRPLHLMYASASVSLARDAAERAGLLQRGGADLREQLGMQAKLRAALRELRLTEGVLLENALSTLLGQERVELPELQEARPLALDGMSRQAMDQRVSRGRRALTRSPQSWPRRRTAALFDLLRGTDPDE